MRRCISSFRGVRAAGDDESVAALRADLECHRWQRRDRHSSLSRLTRMTTSRLEAFSDAVLAIIITIMVLELEVPHEPTLHALAESATGLLTYLLSFVYLGIYWNNHHHLFQLVGGVRGGVLWANLHLLSGSRLCPSRPPGWMSILAR